MKPQQLGFEYYIIPIKNKKIKNTLMLSFFQKVLLIKQTSLNIMHILIH